VLFLTILYRDLNLLAEGLNKEFIPLFKGYEKAEIDWDYKELPEMQEDVLALVTAYSKAPVTPNELRIILEFERLDIDGMDTVLLMEIKSELMKLD